MLTPHVYESDRREKAWPIFPSRSDHLCIPIPCMHSPIVCDSAIPTRWLHPTNTRYMIVERSSHRHEIWAQKKSPPRACKPGSVSGAAEAASPTAIPLGRRLPVVSSSLPGSRREPDRLMLPVWPCTGWGLPSQASHPACWCALTAPFHHCRRLSAVCCLPSARKFRIIPAKS